MATDMLSGPPPSPGPSTGGGGPTPSFKSLSGNGAGPSQPPQNMPSPGAGQIGGAAVRMATEIDQALKLLAQSVPTLAPWVEKTVMELRQQMGQALQSGGVPTNPTPTGGGKMPDGSQNL